MTEDPTANAANRHPEIGLDPAALEFVTRPGELPADVLRLRERVFRDETRLLAGADLASVDDEAGTHVCLSYRGELVGAALGVPAERSTFPARTGTSPAALTGQYFATRLMVAPEFRNRGLASLLVYGILREGRILGRKRVVGLFDRPDAVPAVLAGAVRVLGLRPVQYSGHERTDVELTPMSADVDYGMYRAWERLPQDLRAAVADRLLPDEVVRTVLHETGRFYENPWFSRVSAGTLTRGQYVEFLANSYQFVRWTTRILARVAGLAEDDDLRRHYLNHLSGEMDHEKLIERDLAHLGADVEYVRRHMSPCVDVGHFMGVQESLVGFRTDPVTLLAVPLAIESLTAHLGDGFLAKLEACVRAWGYERPELATAYLRSHVPIDGGDDGHWERTRRVVGRFLRTEPETRRFAGVARMVITAMDRAFRSYVEHEDFI